ncbi:ferritin-like domain-containing protein [Brevibacillus migulae]|uniref:ferritin-like domain-containing protein n=1 Tax=Brevibacillus migulae TaxID=1644114 RepID=UPI00106EE5A5|nr:ferritin-like domain-containing protein [Brevibacillus migulae]
MLATYTPTIPQAQANVPIPNPPRAISTKDLSYLKDALSWELDAFKKFHFYAQQVQDPQIKQALDQAGQMHQRHFQRLLSHLQVNNTAVMSSLPRTQ